MAYRGVLKVVSDKELEAHTSQGWELLELVTETSVVAWSQEQVAAQQPGMMPMQQSRPCTGTVTRYLVRKNEESAIADAGAKLSEAQKRACVLEGEAKEQAEKIRQLTSANEVFRKEAHDNALSQDKWRHEHATLRDRYKTMEQDLGKVRKELGEREWARIVGTASK